MSVRNLTGQYKSSEIQKTTVKEIIDTAINIIEPRLDSEQIRLVRLGQEQHFSRCKPGEIVQILVNLLLSAIDSAMCMDTSERAVTLKTEKVGNDIHITIFDLEQGADSLAIQTGPDKSVVDGVGLTVSKMLAEINSANLLFETTAGHHSMVLKLPCAEATLVHATETVAG